MLGWIRAARETKGAISWDEYRSLSAMDRSILHAQIDTVLEIIDQQFEAAQKQVKVK